MANRIKEILDAKGWTLQHFGDLIGVSKGAVSHWINGDVSNLKNEHLFRIEDTTGYSARWISCGKGPKKVPKVSECTPAYSAQTIAIADMIETLDDEGKRSIQGSVEKEKRLQDMILLVEKMKATG